ncbi:MAG: tetratricopeptide repeat protein [Acidobacteriota bacterium]|nr:tetratricopeptide repeat protein [Acidobacteriota bacterium]
MPRRLRTAAFALLLSAAACSQSAPGAGPSEGPYDNIRAAEQALKKKDLYLAESEYRFAAARALVAIGNLASAKGEWDAALTAYGEASQQLSDPSEPLLSVATVYLQRQKPLQAEAVLRELAATGRTPRVMHLMAVAYAAQGRFGEAMQQIEEARHAAPEDAELAHAEGTIAIQAKDVASARRAFAALLQLRPGAPTHVLIGRTWRDYEHFEEARQELQAALRLDPHVRRANYYLGTILIRQPDRLRDAIAAFQRELEIAPDDYLCNLNAGIGLTADRRAAEGVPYLEKAARLSNESRPLYHLGQAQFQSGEFAGAVQSLERFLAAAANDPQATANAGSAEYVLAQALHALGRDTDAAAHFERAKELKEKYRAQSEDQLQHYLIPDPGSGMSGKTAVWQISSAPPPDGPALTAARTALIEVIARSYFNLGVILSQRKHYRSAAASFYRAATWDPAFPGAQASLGMARFQAGEHALAIEPLRRALASDPGNRDLARLLALSCFQIQSYACAAELLANDAAVENDASLQYALGVSLVKSGEPKRAADVFARLLARNGDSAPLYVLLGDAHAQQGDFDGAIAQYVHALRLDARVPGAHFSSGVIELRRGHLAEAEHHFRAELSAHPDDNRARYHLAYTLSLEGKRAEALPLVRDVLKRTPAFFDGRYLLGQMLLEEGDAAGAVEQLEASVRLAPKEARAHYQLGRAYQKLGRTDDAQQQFTLFQQLKHGEEKP